MFLVLATPELVPSHVMVSPNVALEYVRVDHPAEYLFMEAAAGGIAFFPGADTEWSEYGSAIPDLGPARTGPESGNAPVHVLVPLRDTRRNSLIEVGS